MIKCATNNSVKEAEDKIVEDGLFMVEKDNLVVIPHAVPVFQCYNENRVPR